MRKHFWVLVIVVLMMLWAGPVSAQELPPPHLGYGMMVAYPLGNLAQVPDAGFDWFKYFFYWDDIDPEHDRTYNWESVDWRLGEACTYDLNLLMRIERNRTDWTPIQDDEMDDWQAFFQALAEHLTLARADCKEQNQVEYYVAVEVWNEPNLDFQWNGDLDPARYTEMVKRAYNGVKAGDPSVLVVAGSLAPTGGDGGVHSMNDVTFLEAMYAAGLKGHFDAMSIHNYGYGGEPEDRTYGYDILNFRRAEDIYQVMVDNGDANRPVWATEFGWLLDSDEEEVECDSDWESSGFAWQQVSAIQQSDYLTRAFAYADVNWPWMQVMIVSNLDFNTTDWLDVCDPLSWFAVLNPDGDPRQAYTALKNMEKRPKTAYDIASMALSPSTLDWSIWVRERTVMTETVTVQNTGDVPFTWTVTLAAPALPLTISPTTGSAGEAFNVVLDAREIPTGTYTGIITVTASRPEMIQNPITIPVTVDVYGIWRMEVQPTTLSWRTTVTEAQPVAATVSVVNTGDYSFDWEVLTHTAGLTFTVVPTQSVWQQTMSIYLSTFQVFVDPRGLPVGIHTGTVTITTVPTNVMTPVGQSPFILPLTFRILPRLHEVYLPIILRH